MYRGMGGGYPSTYRCINKNTPMNSIKGMSTSTCVVLREKEREKGRGREEEMGVGADRGMDEGI